MGAVTWDVEARGGPYDGFTGETEQDPGEVLVLWRCAPGCPGHATFDASAPQIVLRTAESYKRTELDPVEHHAVYEQGDGPTGPAVEDDARELVGAGAGPSYGDGLWP